ncbi:hypothetical protein [Eubacterium sp. 1001713B170207_170306_E7]|uniref:hypothetical protein n=1 Tax=Eubacterium sp. 1001713B170207_170306_E7 TaxID=2787097 RepID=UPI001897D786|nr:hypothetical protein [Eubacterium sp. 1001713B170207_170306_E7]
MDNKDAKQCHRLFLSELATMVVCGYLVYLLSTTLEGGLDIRLMLPGGILIFTLLQGCGYWLYRDRAASGNPVNRAAVLRIFSLLKRVTPFVIGLYPLLLFVLLFADRSALFVPFNLFGLILLFFSIAEYVNYYHFSMNIWNFKARTPSDLSEELAAFNQKEE